MSKHVTLYQPYFSNRAIRRQVYKEAQRDFRPAIEARMNSILRDRKIAYENALTVKQMREKAADDALTNLKGYFEGVELTPEQRENIVAAGIRSRGRPPNFAVAAKAVTVET